MVLTTILKTLDKRFHDNRRIARSWLGENAYPNFQPGYKFISVLLTNAAFSCRHGSGWTE